jgi:hypothetical protein
VADRLSPVDGAALRCGDVLRPFSPSSARVQSWARVYQGQRTALVTGEGRWSSCDVHLQCPASWVTAGAVLELWTQAEGVAALAARVDLSVAPLEVRGDTVSGRVLGVRARPGDRFEVVAIVPPPDTTPIALAQGRIVLELWGDQGGPACAVGPLPFDGQTLQDQPAPAQAFAMVWDDASGAWNRARQAGAPSTTIATLPVFTATATATAVAGAQPAQAVMVKAPSTNADIVYVGSSTVTPSNGIPLDPGDFLVLAVNDVSKVYGIASAGSPELRVMVLA